MIAEWIRVRVEWVNQPDPRLAWPGAIDDVPLERRCWFWGRGVRSVKTRRIISHIIGTDRWLWTGPNSIRAEGWKK